MLNVIGYSGIPASGKTTLMREFLKGLCKPKGYKKGLLTYQQYDENKCIVLGLYGKNTFGGTDRLSMAVQPDAIKVFKEWTKNDTMNGWSILFEGDRLFNFSFLNLLESIPEIKYNWYIIEISEGEQKRRHEKRKDNQNEIWLKGRVSKINNLKKSLKNVIILSNETEKELKKNVELFLGLIKS